MTDLLKLLLGAGILVAAVGLRREARHRIAKHGIPLLLWRWVSGMPHDGGPLDGSRFWARPRWQRSARRTGLTAAAIAASWGLLFHPKVTLLVMALCAVGGIAYGIAVLVRWAKSLRHHRVWVHPAHLVAAPLVGLDPASADPSWLAIEPDRSRVVAELPAAYNPDDKQRQRLVETLSGKLGIESPEVKWALAGPRPRLELARSKPPPGRVGLADVRAAIEAAKPDEIVWGLGKKQQVVKTSLSGDSPHVGLSMGSGGGKSETAKSLLAQQLHRGAIGLILDHKMNSHPWAKGLPNVVTAVRIPEIHKALVWLGGHEVTRRKEVAYAGTDMHGNVHADVGPRIIIIAEELNATVAQLRSYWREIRAKDDPVRSPALTGLDEVSFTGRSVLMNLVYIGQRLSDKATGGGGDGRENIGVIVFARFRQSTWKMLAPDFVMPPKTLHPGRIHVVSDQVQEAQGVLMTTEEARELATSGAVSALPYGMPGARATAEARGGEIAVHGLELRTATVSAPFLAAPVSSAVTLREAVKAGVLPGLTLAGARTARHRDDTFPRHVGRDGTAELYDPQALANWAKARTT